MPHPKVKLSDDSGNAVSVTSNRLDVNAYLSATPTIDIGDVSLLLGGTAASVNNGTADATTLRVTIASDSTYTPKVAGIAAENATVSGNPVLTGGRYDSVSRNLGDGDVGAIALTSKGWVQVSGTVVLGAGSANIGKLTSPAGGTYIGDIQFGESLPSGSNTIGVVDLGATDNAVLDAIAASLEILDDWDDNNYANVNINLAGSDAPTGGGSESGALRVTLANDSTGVISIDDGGNTITVDGTVTANLSSTDNTVLDNILTKNTEIDAVLDTIKVDTEAIETAVELLDNAIDGNEMQVDIVSSATLSVNSHAVTNAGTFVTQIDGDALTSLQLIDDAVAAEGEALGKGILLQGDDGTDRHNINVDNNGRIKVKVDSITNGGINHPFQIVGTSYTATDAHVLGSVAVRNDTLAALTSVIDGDWSSLQVDAEGALYTTHGVTGMQSDNNEGVDSSTAEVLKSSTACKRVDMQADPANTGYIYVGGSDVSAVKGIRLAPGDFYSIDVNNTADIYVLASVDEEDIHFTYYT